MEEFYSRLFEYEYSESEEDEEILPHTVIPRHLHQKLKAERYYDPRLREDEVESDEDEVESDEDEEIPSLTKVVIRHLPPDMNGNLFFQLVSPLPAHDYKYFAEASKEYKENARATAYINFVDSEDALLFMKKFDGHAFHCNNGNMYKAMVEFSPSGQIPKPPPSRDPLSGTIDNDPDYLEFLASMETKTTDRRDGNDEVTEATSKPSTPLVDYLNRERAVRIASRKYRPRGYFRNMHSKFRPMVG